MHIVVVHNIMGVYRVYKEHLRHDKILSTLIMHVVQGLKTPHTIMNTVMIKVEEGAGRP